MRIIRRVWVCSESHSAHSWGEGHDLTAGGVPPGSVEMVSWNSPAIGPLTPLHTISENPCSP